MVIELVQFALLGLLGVLVLGLYRQLAHFLAPPSLRLEDAGGPPVGKILPAPLHDVVQRVGVAADEMAVLAYVSEDCVACQRLLAEIDGSGFAELAAREGRRVVLIVRPGSDAFRDAIRRLQLPSVFDDDGALWAISALVATPLLLEVSNDGRVVRKAADFAITRFVASPETVS